MAILRAEVMAPFADAVRLVDGEQVDVPGLEIFQKAGEHEAFGRDVEQAEFAIVQAAKAWAGFALGER